MNDYLGTRREGCVCTWGYPIGFPPSKEFLITEPVSPLGKFLTVLFLLGVIGGFHRQSYTVFGSLLFLEFG